MPQERRHAHGTGSGQTLHSTKPASETSAEPSGTNQMLLLAARVHLHTTTLLGPGSEAQPGLAVAQRLPQQRLQVKARVV